ncbi:MAG: metallophosphoesterase [Ignavibacteria bacterium]|jgi:serine/threonine protein phosphatase 1|nr:metallophosphoesterase [Ignavibacteria bacterium]
MYAVIGDVHGCFHTLVGLVADIRDTYGDMAIYSVGDLGDRGRYTPEVFNLFDGEGIKFVKGNHDVMFYYGVTEPSNPISLPWIYNGNEATIEAYKLQSHLLTKHLKMIEDAPYFFLLEDALISHAGISEKYAHKIFTNKIIDIQKLRNFAEKYFDDESGMLWNRGLLANVGKLQIVGHCRYNEVVYKENNNSLYIDTSVYMANKLSAVIIEEGRLIKILSTPTFIDDLV